MERAYINLYPERMRGNVRRIMQRLPERTKLCLVVKADAYGLGAAQLAPALESDADFFATATATEALQLRKCGITKPILILGFTGREDWPELVRSGVRITVYRRAYAEELSRMMVRLGETALIHLKLDTGMNRLGFEPNEEDADELLKIAALPGLKVEGLFSHFARADERDLSAARTQYERFCWMKQTLKARGLAPEICHIANSAAAMVFPEAAEDMVRLGIAAYGLVPSSEMDIPVKLEPVAEWKSGVVMVKDLLPGEAVSYGGKFTAKRFMRLATVPVGYADGYTRRLSGKSRVLIRGQYAPVCGTICMDQMMVDVTDIPGVATGDEVTLIGRDGDKEITLEELASLSGNLNYEFQCGLSRWRDGRHVIEE